jgi:TonB-dependent SusC/RagA subfamily outer membrane receptor
MAMVPAILIYLLKANIALTMFFLAYRFGLRRLTFYTLNRVFLLTGIAFSSLFPFIDIDAFVNKHEVIALGVMTYVPDLAALRTPAPVFTAWTALVYVFWIGVSVMAIRFFIQLFSLWRIHRKSQRGRIDDITVQLLQQPVNPFSFFRHIYINPSLHQPEELPAILHHEKVHVRQWHTADALLGEVNNIFYWFNPGAWLMKTAIRENLEFITDRYLLRQGVDKTSYQYNLIKVSGIPYATAIANNFNFSHLKKRIIMMNSKKSSRYQVVRYLVLGLLVGGTVLSLNYTKASTVIPFTGISDTVPPPPPPPPPPTPPTPPPPPAKGKKVVPPPAVEEIRITSPKPAAGVKEVRVKSAEPAVLSKGNTITVSGGNPAASAKGNVITIRSANKNEPVYVVNGKVMGKAELEAIKPGDIASINVVKDPSPESKENLVKEYGGKVDNGVVFVQLKQSAEPIGVTFHANSKAAIPDDILVVVDGVPHPKGKGINDIPADNIERVDVLKNEAAKALYGPAAENGVIQITTKTGKGGSGNYIKLSADTVKIK